MVTKNNNKVTDTKQTSKTSESFGKGHQVRATVFYRIYNVIGIQVWAVMGTYVFKVRLRGVNCEVTAWTLPITKHRSRHDSKQALHKFRSTDPMVKSMVPDLAPG